MAFEHLVIMMIFFDAGIKIYLLVSLMRIPFFILKMKRRQIKEKQYRKILLLQADMLLIEALSGMTAEELLDGWEQTLSNLEDPLFLYHLEEERIRYYHGIISEHLNDLKKIGCVIENPSFNVQRIARIHSDLTRLLKS